VQALSSRQLKSLKMVMPCISRWMKDAGDKGQHIWREILCEKIYLLEAHLQRVIEKERITQ